MRGNHHHGILSEPWPESKHQCYPACIFPLNPNVLYSEEKSQSMLYRFREQKAMEMGMINRTDRRPRLASMCNDLRQCERWRGEILRDVSRKVSKIQDRPCRPSLKCERC